MSFSIIHRNARAHHDLNRKHHLHSLKVRATEGAFLVSRKNQEKQNEIYLETRLLILDSAEKASSDKEKSQEEVDSYDLNKLFSDVSKLLHLNYSSRI